MKTLKFFMHISLDGFVAGPNGELDWIKLDDEMFDFVATMTEQADMALYGRVTYDMMESYWPTAADKPDATKHDKEHAAWYNSVEKIVLSKTITNEGRGNTTVISNQLVGTIKKIKKQKGKDILIFGSPGASRTLINKGLIDEFWFFVNPIILGRGISLSKKTNTAKLALVESKIFPCGVVALHYKKI